jgi:hypothetical protein
MDLRRSRRWMLAILTVGAIALGVAVPAAQAGTANGGLPGAGSNPIANVVWGVPRNDDLWNAYESVSGSNRT